MDAVDSCELLSNCIFEELITACFAALKTGTCCELLSNCIFEELITAVH